MRSGLCWGKSPDERHSPTSPSRRSKILQNPDGNNPWWVLSVSIAEQRRVPPGRDTEVNANLKEHPEGESLFGLAVMLQMEKNRSRGRTTAARALHAPKSPQAERLFARSPPQPPTLPLLQRFHCSPKTGEAKGARR